MDRIVEFNGKHRFLSNFHKHPVMYQGILYPSNEHAYQASKTLDVHVRRKIAAAATPGRAKRLGRSVSLRRNWETIKVGIMSELIWTKFTDPELCRMLLATGDAVLIEGNSWNDTFWGVCDGKGRNMLGELLMATRYTINNLCS